MAEALRPGTVLDGRYQLVRPLGEGGMGAVWVARQIALERDVAIKVIHAAAAAHRPRLRREALALAAVHHPAIVQVYDYGEIEGGEPYIVLELVQGQSLAAHLAEKGPFAVDDAVALLLPILDGLAAAHRAGIVHRDVKPDNVLLAPTSAGLAPRILDFGIARVVQGGEAAERTSGLLGTPAYMAPEQVLSTDTDERTDVWAAGVVLYEMVSGRRPFEGDDVFAIMRKIIADPPAYPRAARGLDGRLWSILMGALRKSRDDRTPSATALHGALSEWLAARGARPRPAPAPEPPRTAVDAPLAPTLPAAPGRSVPPAPPVPPREDVPPSIDALIRDKLARS
jgi:serine/threonine-protein kinase